MSTDTMQAQENQPSSTFEGNGQCFKCLEHAKKTADTIDEMTNLATKHYEKVSELKTNISALESECNMLKKQLEQTKNGDVYIIDPHAKKLYGMKLIAPYILSLIYILHSDGKFLNSPKESDIAVLILLVGTLVSSNILWKVISKIPFISDIYGIFKKDSSNNSDI